MADLSSSAKNILALYAQPGAFVVPDYQRSFTWEKKQVHQLTSDLLDSFFEDANGDYFLGNIIFVNRGDKFEIIDGQHRLTSIYLLLLALSVMAKDKELKNNLMSCLNQRSGEIKIRLADRHQSFLEEISSADSIIDLLSSRDEHNLRSTEVHIFKALKEIFNALAASLKNPDLIDNFSKWLLDNCVVVQTELSSRERAFKVFTIINTRGVDLNEVDYIRSILIGDDIRQFRDFCPLWDQIYEESGRPSLNAALRAYTHAVNGYGKSDFSRCFWNRSSLLLDEKEVELARLNDYLMKYKQYFIQGNLPEGLTNEKLRNAAAYFRTMCALPHTEWQGLFLKMLNVDQNFSLPNKWEAFLFDLERATLAFSILGRQSSSRNQSYQEAWTAIHNNFEKIDVGLGDTPTRTWNEVEKRIKTDAYKKTWCTALLMKLNHISDENSNGIVHSIDLHIEHILPQRPAKKSEWRKNFPKPETYSDRLGNLVLLRGERNRRLSNADFDEKKVRFEQGKSVTLPHTLRAYKSSKWTSVQIRSATETACAELKAAWFGEK